VFGYFHVDGPRRPVTVRRLGTVVGEDLVFQLRDSGRMTLRLAAGHLVGDVLDPAGQLLPGGGTVELGRFRP
jgi:hypothetical protein